MFPPPSASVSPSPSPSPSASGSDPSGSGSGSGFGPGSSSAFSFAGESPSRLRRWQKAAGQWARREWIALRQKLDPHNNFVIRCCCVLLMVKCAFVALTGRGVVSIIQAIVGVIFSIEGFWGAVKFDGPTVKRFLIFVVAYFLLSAAISVINLQTLDEYCSTAVDTDDKRYCLDTSRLYSYLLLAATLGVLPVIFGFGVVFYLSIPAGGLVPRRRTGGSALDVYQLTDAMGFSSD